MKASKGKVVPCSDIYGVGIDLKSGGDTHYASIVIYRESTQEAAELRDFIIDAINDKYSDEETGMNNRELIKELLKLNDEALKEIGRTGMTGEGRKVAEHYVGGEQ